MLNIHPEIKKVYRIFCLNFHPDRNDDGEEIFKYGSLLFNTNPKKFLNFIKENKLFDFDLSVYKYVPSIADEEKYKYITKILDISNRFEHSLKNISINAIKQESFKSIRDFIVMKISQIYMRYFNEINENYDHLPKLKVIMFESLDRVLDICIIDIWKNIHDSTASYRNTPDYDHPIIQQLIKLGDRLPDDIYQRIYLRISDFVVDTLKDKTIVLNVEPPKNESMASNVYVVWYI